MKKYSLLKGREFIDTLSKLLDFDPSNVQRVTITADVREMVIIEIIEIGDTRLIEFDWSKLKQDNDQ
jgi:hypothetical protein